MHSKSSLKKVKWIVFDIDGVLINADDSFDECVIRTVKYFAGKNILRSLTKKFVRKIRYTGRFGDDFKIVEAILSILKNGKKDLSPLEKPGISAEEIIKIFGAGVPHKEVEKIFNMLYLGGEGGFHNEGLWKKERANISKETLEQVKVKFRTGIITGRSKKEVSLAMKILGTSFKHIITREYGLKPDPMLLFKLVGKTSDGIYIGDTSNDVVFIENYNKKFGEKFGFEQADNPEKLNRIIKHLLSQA